VAGVAEQLEADFTRLKKLHVDQNANEQQGRGAAALGVADGKTGVSAATFC
jgi:hypothetical protein